MKWVLKTSAVRVSTPEKDRIYRSIDDVPARLRAKIRRTLEGPNAETLLIANQAAYDQIVEEAAETEATDPDETSGNKLVVGSASSWGLVLAIALAAFSVVSLIGLWFIQAGKW